MRSRRHGAPPDQFSQDSVVIGCRDLEMVDITFVDPRREWVSTGSSVPSRLSELRRMPDVGFATYALMVAVLDILL